MLRQMRLLLGISVFWLGLSMLTDGINTLVLPLQLSTLLGKNSQATGLGLLTFGGLLLGALIQPYAGSLSDGLRLRLARKGFIAFGLGLSLAALLVFAVLHNLLGVIAGYLGMQISASIAQAGQQGLIPDLVDQRNRGMASGMKSFMDVGGAMVGFLVLGHLLSTGSLLLAVSAIAVALVVLYAVAILLTPEDRASGSGPLRNEPPREKTGSLWQSLRIDVRMHRAFMRLVLARLLFLLGIYATGRFLFYFVSDRLKLQAGPAALQAGNILAVLTFITVLASPVGGWLADRIGRLPIMLAGSLMGALSAVLLIFARSEVQIVVFGALMSLGSAAFSGGSWALLADLVPKRESARFFGIANFSTAGASALAGLLGPVLDAGQRAAPGSGYTVLFLMAALAFSASAFPLNRSILKEASDDRTTSRTENEIRSHGAGLAVVHLPADPAGPEEDQDPQAGPAAP